MGRGRQADVDVQVQVDVQSVYENVFLTDLCSLRARILILDGVRLSVDDLGEFIRVQIVSLAVDAQLLQADGESKS